MVNIGVIGTAGRGQDINLLNVATFTFMRQTVLRLSSVIANGRAIHLISGGAAWADHSIIPLFNEGLIDKLTLYLPANFQTDTLEYENTHDGGIANFYHKRFSQKCYITCRASLNEINDARLRGATLNVNKSGFKARNIQVAIASDYLIAFTFGEGAKLKDGGTAHTMGAFLLTKFPENSYHVNLNNREIYNPAQT